MMNKKLIIFLTFIGLIGIFTGCEKDGEQIVMSANPVTPMLQTIPDLSLQRNKANDTLTFIATAVDPGFAASATYVLEACAQGTNFVDKVTIYSGVKPSPIKITVSDLNSLMLKKFPGDEPLTLDFRLRSVLVVDAGTGSPGNSGNPLEYSSPVTSVSVTLYGLPKLDLINSGTDQKVESPSGNGVYSGVVKLNPASPFTLFDPDGSISYGGSGGTLTADGAAIVSDQDGWSKLTVDLNTLTYTIEQFSMGVIGTSVPPYDWSVDVNMDYDSNKSMWYITLDLQAGVLKFRRNDGWAWNMGFIEGTENPGLSGPTQQGGVGNDIPVPVAGNYTVTLTVNSDTDGYYEITKNE